MTKRIYRTFWSLFTLLALLLLFAPRALADGPITSGTDAIRVSEDGTVTLLSGHIAGEGVSSLQLTLETAGEASFAFSDGIKAAYMTNVTSAEGGLTLYIAGTKPLMAAGQTELVLGTVSGVASESVKLAAGSPQYVYGTRVIGQNLELDDGTGVSDARSALEQKLSDVDSVYGLDSVQKLYSEESRKALLDAVSEARELLKTEASDDELTAAFQKIENAILGLRTDAEEGLYKQLADALVEAERGSYTPESLAALKDAIQAAQAALDSEDETAIKNATEALQDALRKLVHTADPDSNGTVHSDGDQSQSGGENAADATATPTAAAAATAGQATAPNTGDEQALLPWAGLLVLSGALLTAVIRRRARCGR